MSNDSLVGATVMIEWEHLPPVEGIVTCFPYATGDSWQLQPWWLAYGDTVGVAPTIHQTPLLAQTFARLTVLKEKDHSNGT